MRMARSLLFDEGEAAAANLRKAVHFARRALGWPWWLVVVLAVMGGTLAGAAGRICYNYCGRLYRQFDAVFALSENGGATKLRSYGVEDVGIDPEQDRDVRGETTGRHDVDAGRGVRPDR